MDEKCFVRMYALYVCMYLGKRDVVDVPSLEE
jgi:hypothetical protein